MLQDKLDVLQLFRIESEFEKMRFLNASVSYELNNANRFFYQLNIPIRDCMKSLFKNELYGIDFKTDVMQSKKFIDDWVSNQTQHQINDLIANIHVSQQTKLILVRIVRMIYLFLFHIIIVQPKPCFIYKTVTEFLLIRKNFDYFLKLQDHGDELILKCSK